MIFQRVQNIKQQQKQQLPSTHSPLTVLDRSHKKQDNCHAFGIKNGVTASSPQYLKLPPENNSCAIFSTKYRKMWQSRKKSFPLIIHCKFLSLSLFDHAFCFTTLLDTQLHHIFPSLEARNCISWTDCQTYSKNSLVIVKEVVVLRQSPYLLVCNHSVNNSPQDTLDSNSL